MAETKTVPAEKTATEQVYIWISSLRGVLVIVARSEKEARKLAIERDPIYAKWFLSVRPQVIDKVIGAEVFTFAGGRRS